MGEKNQLTEDDKGKTVAARVGEAIEVVLEENPSTGYAWQHGTIEGLEIASELRGDGSGMPGAGGKRVFRLTPTRPGTVEVRLVYRRSWEAETPSDETFSVSLDVT